MELEKKERIKLLDSLRGTVEQAKAAGHAEERLQGEVAKLEAQVEHERQSLLHSETELKNIKAEYERMKTELTAVSTKLLESQNLAKLQSQEVSKWQHKNHEAVLCESFIPTWSMRPWDAHVTGCAGKETAASVRQSCSFPT